MPANPLPEQLARLEIAIARNVEILDSGSFFQRKVREMALSAYNRSEIDKRAKQIQREARIVLASVRNYSDDEQTASLNAIEAIRLHCQAIAEYLK